MSRWVILLLFAAAVAFAEEDSAVVVLDADNFHDGIAGKPLLLMEFYAPWCGHCKRLEPEYEIAAKALAVADPPVILAKVDCPANTELCAEFGVTGYPTIKIFRDGLISGNYEGPRNADGIIAFMMKQSGPSARELPGTEEVRVFIESEEHSVVGFFSGEDEKAVKHFRTYADNMREDFRFALTTNADVLEEYGYKDQVVVFRPPGMSTKMEDSRIVWDGENLNAFVKENFMGLAGLRNSDNMKFFQERQPLVVVYFDIDYALNAKGSNYWRNRVIKVAKDFVGKVNFAVSDKDDFSAELQALGFADTSEEVVAGLYDSAGKYSMTGKFSVDALRTFVQQYLDGEIEVYIKSEPVPEDNNGPVKVVVGKNFDEIVNAEGKDVLLEFYAPWCGHCKSLAPKYEELGEKLSGDPNIVIAKGDATANDYPPGFEVRGYPTIFWKPAGRAAEKYEGGREVSDFISFIKKNATNKPVVVAEEEKKKKKKKEL